MKSLGPALKLQIMPSANGSSPCSLALVMSNGSDVDSIAISLPITMWYTNADQYSTIVELQTLVMCGFIHSNTAVVRTSSALVSASTLLRLTAAATKKIGG